MSKINWICIAIVFSGFSTCFGADDLNTAFNLHLSAFPPSPSSAGMGGTWAATPYPISHNAACFARMPDYGIETLLYSSPTFYQFDSGPETKIWINSVSLDLHNRHFLRLASFNAWSEESQARSGLDTRLKLDISEIAYAYRFSPELSFGASIYPFRNIDVEGKLQNTLFFENRSRTDFNGRVGLLYEPLKDFFFGAAFQYTKENVDNKILNPLSGSYIKTDNNYYSRILRLGTSWRPWKGGLISIDRQFGEIDGPIEDKDAGKWFMGFEQAVSTEPAILLRVGSLDHSPTFGIGIYHKNQVFFDYTFIDGANRDLEPFFGDSQVHMFSLGIAF